MPHLMSACGGGAFQRKVKEIHIPPLIVVQSETEFALIRTQMILHEIRILVQIDCLQRQLSQPLASVPIRFRPRGMAATAGFTSGTVRHRGEVVSTLLVPIPLKIKNTSQLIKNPIGCNLIWILYTFLQI